MRYPYFTILFLVIAGCGARESAPVKVEVAPARERTRVELPKVRFRDATSEAGLAFAHFNGAFGKKLLPETMGGGVVVFDYNKDGKPDLFFINSCPWHGHEAPSGPRPTSRLYRNDSDGKSVRFTDVSAPVGLDLSLYGMGGTAADYDNDGWPDLYVTGLGGCRLFHNEEDGQGGRRFRDVTATAGVAGPEGWPTTGDLLEHDRPVPWPTSAGFVDYDGDGKLDLFVCYYITWSPKYDLSLASTLKGARDRAFGPPIAFPGSQCVLYRNLGGGKFEDVSEKAGIRVFDQEGTGATARNKAVGKSLGVAIRDVDGDGWPDIFVANDTVRNFLFHNRGNGTFEEKGLTCGIGLAEGSARGAMGIDIAEYRPGRQAVLIGNFADEPDTFLSLLRPRDLSFRDEALQEGLWGPSRPLLKFGVFFFDYDLDGRMDVLTCNGHLEPDIAQVQPAQRFAQPAQLFWNTGARQGYEPVTPAASGEDLFRPMVGRGSAFADVNGDGAPDIILVANGGPARLLLNEGGTGHHWVKLHLQGDGGHSHRDALGARVTLEAGGIVRQAEVVGARGYLSQSEIVLTFGLGPTDKIDRLTIRWPGKEQNNQVLTNLAVDRLHTIVQGK